MGQKTIKEPDIKLIGYTEIIPEKPVSYCTNIVERACLILGFEFNPIVKSIKFHSKETSKSDLQWDFSGYEKLTMG